MKNGIELISDERKRQIEEEGFSKLMDSYLNPNDLTMASICYMKANLMSFENAIEDFPWASSCFKPKDKLRNLVRAGALIAAEIDKFLEESDAKNE